MPAAEISPLEAFISADRRAAVVVLLAGRRVGAVHRLTGGASGADMLRLDCEDEIAVLRLDGPPDGFRDPARQYACQAIAAARGVAPALLASDAAERLSLSAFVAPGA